MATYLVPNYSSKIIDERTGLIDRNWYLFFQNLFNNAGGGALGTATQVLHGSGAGFSSVVLQSDVSGLLPLANFTQGASGSLLIGQGATAAAYKAITGDAAFAASGAITVTKTNGSAFVASATIDTTNASNISSGTLPTARFETIGAWTPADASGAGLVFSAVSANYTQIANIVHAYATWTYPVTIDGSAASISGLPVTVANANYAQVPAICSATVSISGGLVLVPNKNAATAKFDVGSPFGAVTNAQLSGGTISVLLTYPIT